MQNKDLPSHVLGLSESIIHICDLETNELYFVNHVAINALENLGVTEWKGKTCHKTIQGREEQCTFCKARVWDEENTNYCEYYNNPLDKSFHLKSQIIDYQGKKCRLEISTDITYQTDLEKEINLKIEEQEVLKECVKVLNSKNSPKEAIQKLLKLFVKYYKAEKSCIFSLSQDGKSLGNAFGCSENCDDIYTHELLNVPIESIYFPKDGDDISRVFFNEKTDNLQEKGECRLITAPLVDENEQIKGYICIFNPKENQLNGNSIKMIGKFISDFIKKNKLIEELNALSFRDSLTGLKNYLNYRNKIEKYEQKQPKSLGVLYIDLNGLKRISSARGHNYADELIVEFSENLYDIFGDNIYRINGNEIVVLAENIEEEIFENLIKNVQNIIKKDDPLEISMGYSWNSSSNFNQENIEMLSSEKNKQYNNFLRENIMREIANGRFLVEYQPKVDLESEKIIGCEALIRKLDSKGNMVLPVLFIPFYEKQEIISAIDFYTLNEACKFLNKLKIEKNVDDIKISVNFSRISLIEYGALEKSIEICKKHKVDPSKITIEITESVQGISQKLLIELFDKFLEAGFTLALDDFGTGYSNMSLISAGKFKEIKIDKSLIDDVMTKNKTNILTKLIVSACMKFPETQVIAEGIESVQQVKELQSMNCKQGQGFYFAKSMNQENFLNHYFANKI